MPEPIRILLADDHTMFRAGLRALLEAESNIEVVGEAATGDEAVDRARTLRPDVVLVLTVHAEEEYLVPVVQAGASGYLTKTSADRDLIEAIRIVARGEVYLPPQATKLLLQEYKAAESDPDAPSLRQLSSREQEVLALTAEGYTVDTYRSRIMQKLGLTHRSELVRFALKVGLLKEK
jgi:two-component system response regulator NreC